MNKPRKTINPKPTQDPAYPDRTTDADFDIAEEFVNSTPTTELFCSALTFNFGTVCAKQLGEMGYDGDNLVQTMMTVLGLDGACMLEINTRYVLDQTLYFKILENIINFPLDQILAIREYLYQLIASGKRITLVQRFLVNDLNNHLNSHGSSMGQSHGPLDRLLKKNHLECCSTPTDRLKFSTRSTQYNKSRFDPTKDPSFIDDVINHDMSRIKSILDRHEDFDYDEVEQLLNLATIEQRVKLIKFFQQTRLFQVKTVILTNTYKGLDAFLGLFFFLGLTPPSYKKNKNRDYHPMDALEKAFVKSLRRSQMKAKKAAEERVEKAKMTIAMDKAIAMTNKDEVNALEKAEIAEELTKAMAALEKAERALDIDHFLNDFNHRSPLHKILLKSLLEKNNFTAVQYEQLNALFTKHTWLEPEGFEFLSVNDTTDPTPVPTTGPWATMARASATKEVSESVQLRLKKAEMKAVEQRKRKKLMKAQDNSEVEDWMNQSQTFDDSRTVQEYGEDEYVQEYGEDEYVQEYGEDEYVQEYGEDEYVQEYGEDEGQKFPSSGIMTFSQVPNPNSGMRESCMRDSGMLDAWDY